MRHKLSLIIIALVLALPTWGQGPNPKTGEPAPEAVQDVTVSAAPGSKGPTLSFDWGEKKPALAIVKGTIRQGIGKWWIVFDHSAAVSLPDLKEHPVPGLVNIDTVSAKEGAVLQVCVDSQQTPVVMQEGHQWQVYFKPQPLALQESATIQLPQTKKGSLAVSLKAFGKEVRFKDPHTGYTHVVFASRQVGFGIAESQSFPEFHISSMAQGVGFQLLKDDITVNATSDQATVMHPEGLSLTLPQEREQVRMPPTPTGFFADAQGLDWSNRQQKINEELLDLPHDQHGPGELEIAWLFVSYGQAEEALGYLAHLARMRPSIANVPLFKALRGVGNLVLNQLSESERSLSDLPEDPEVQAWLSLVSALQQPDCSRMDLRFQMARPMVQSYPKPLRRQMVTLILKACIATGDLETLALFLDQGVYPEDVKEKEVFDLARASVLMGQNKPDAALQILGALIEKAVSTDVRDIALFKYVAHRLETKMMREEDALPQLERLRFQGRGWLSHRVAGYLADWKAGKTEAD